MITITQILLIATVGVSFIALTQREYMAKLEYNPYLVHHRGQWYRMLTHALIHADFYHLAVNMWVLYMFGSGVEGRFQSMFGGVGKIYFLGLYILGVLFATLPAYRKHKDNFSYNAVGASGAVSAVVFAGIFMNPTAPLGLLFIPIRLPAVVFGVLYLAYEVYMDRRAGPNDRIAHDAHYYGAIFGVVFCILARPSLVLDFIYLIQGLWG